MNPQAVALGLVRIRGAGADTTALRLRAARELQAADLLPDGLPPAAVLVVRRLADPLPGQFGSGRPRPRLAWEAAVRGALHTSARGAARPDRGRIDASAGAVLFADEAEIVACLIADILRGEMTAHWWWRSVLPRLGLSAAIARAGHRDPAIVLHERPRDVPAALALLAQWGELSRLAAALSPGTAASVLRALAQSHDLPDAMIAASDVWLEDAARRAPAAASRAIAPWQRELPVDDRSWAPEIRCLLGVALSLHAAPWRLRSPDAVMAARRWWAEAVRPPTPVEAGAAAAHSGVTASAPSIDASRVMEDAPRPVVVDPDTSLANELHEPAAAASPASPPIDWPEEIGAPPRERLDRRGERAIAARPAAAPDAARHDTPARAARESLIAGGAPAFDPDAPTISEAPAQRSPAQRRPAAHAAEPAHETTSVPTPPTASIDASVPAAWPGECVVTRVGGVLYLVHALENLGLPDAFETRWALASQAGPWGLIDLLGRALLGPRFATFADDPLWPALARLTDWTTKGRGGPDPAFRIPADWLQRLDDASGRFTWTVRDGRLWIWSREGYLVAHRIWRGGNAAAAVRRELATLGAPADARVVRRGEGRVPLLPPSTLPDGCPARFGRLVGAIAPALRRRLLLALGEADVPASRQAKRIADLLTLRARVYLSSSHVDLVTTLDRADLAIRQAGLDRDPGWRPGYGRVIYFHFS